MQIDDLLARLKGVKSNGNNGWLALCPAHDDHHQSLSVTESDGKILVKCFAGCLTEAIVESMNLTMSDLFTDGHKTKSGQDRRLVATFPYCDIDGKESYQIRCYEPKDFKAWHKEGSEYALGMGEYKDKPILYHLPEIPGWIATGKRIYIPEGELKADCIISKEGAATTSPFGAGRNKWRPQFSEMLRGAHVVILPDNDKPGHDFAWDKAASLYGKAKSLKVLELPGLSDKGDIIDWFKTGNTFEQLERLANEAPEWKPKESDISLVCIADVQSEMVSWLWLPYIPRGKLTLFEGDPGIGKSWVSLAIATAVSLGKGLPGTEAIESASVILASAEDGLGDTIRPRLDAMGADVRNVHAIKGALDFGNGGLAILEAYISQLHPALVIIDPLVAYIGAGVDLHRANETRAVMAKLADIAEKHGCAILAIRHLTKGGALKPIYRGLGSIDLAAACRSVLMAGCDPDNPQKRGIVQIKSNLAPMGKAIGYELRDGGFYWTGESDLTAARILAVEDSVDGKSAIDEAADFLRDELADGPVEAKQVFSDAKSLGIYERTLNRAKSKLRITSKREGESGKRGIARVKWQLPEDLEGQKDLGCQDCLIEDIGNVNQISFNNPVDPLGVGNVNTPGLGMPIEKAIEIWRSEGAPVIYLGPGENCEDLALLLSRPDVKPEHLHAVKKWLDSVESRGKTK